MSNHLTVRKERHIAASPKKVWDTLTESTTDWNGVVIETESDWEPNSPIAFSFAWEGKDYADKGRIIAVEPEKIFSHTYWSAFSELPDREENYSIVEYKLLPTAMGTLLILTHTNFATEIMYQHSDTNWEDALDRIKEKCEKQQ